MFTAVLNQKSKIIIKQNITKHNTVGIDYDCITFQKKKKLIYQFILSFTKFKMLNDWIGMLIHLNNKSMK